MFRIKTIYYYYFLINFITSQKCGPKNPSDRNSCLETSNENDKNICCFASVSSINKTDNEIIGSTNLCVLIPIEKTFIAPYLTQMDLGIHNENLKMKVDCGDGNDNFRAYPKCGPEFPKEFDDCKNSSTTKSSCCYFKAQEGNATCLFNPEISKQNVTIYGIVITCGEQFFKLNCYKYLFLILIIMILM